MKFFLSTLLFLITSQDLLTQTPSYKYPLPIINYGVDINNPLTQKELNQIIEVYGECAEKEVLNRPQRLRDIKHLLRNRIEYKLIVQEDLKPLKMLSEIPLFNVYVSSLKRDTAFNPESFNPLKYNIDFFSTTGTMIKVDKTNYYIIIKSQHQ